MTGDTIPAEMVVPRFMGGGEIGFARKPVREPGRGQLLIGVKANALCGSERGQFFDGFGVTPDHEAAGVVEAGPETGTAASPPATRPHRYGRPDTSTTVTASSTGLSTGP
jgi:threonine 3-dehydrogenase